MTSSPTSAYVWFWLPERKEPILAGRVDQEGAVLTFTYSVRYLERRDAIPIFSEIPLERGEQFPRSDIHGCIADAGPDSWGQRVILNRRLGSGADHTTELTRLDYLVSAGADRIGALDFQVEQGEYGRREANPCSLESLMKSAEMVERGAPLPPTLEDALLRGSSIGGARPKALLEDGSKKLIAKFGSTTDLYVKGG